MGYANSVGDFGGLTSYDAHFFFYYLFSSFCYPFTNFNKFA